MTDTPTDATYAETHEWARLDDDGHVVVGVSDYAQEQLGDVVYVELPEVDQQVDAGAEAGVVESVKAASDIYAPVSGTVSPSTPRSRTRPTRKPDPSEMAGSCHRADFVRRIGGPHDAAVLEFWNQSEAGSMTAMEQSSSGAQRLGRCFIGEELGRARRVPSAGPRGTSMEQSSLRRAQRLGTLLPQPGFPHAGIRTMPSTHTNARRGHACWRSSARQTSRTVRQIPAKPAQQ